MNTIFLAAAFLAVEISAPKLLLLLVLVLIVGAAGSYLVLRNNPKYKAYLDAEADKLARRTGTGSSP